MLPRCPIGVTDIIDFNKYFYDYSDFVHSLLQGSKRSPFYYFMKSVGLSRKEYSSLSKKFCEDKFSWKKMKADKFQLPVPGFLDDFKLYDVPEDCSLLSVRYLRDQNYMEKSVNRKTLVQYVGQVNLDAPVKQESDTFNECLTKYVDYVFTVRVYIPTNFRTFATAYRTKSLNVSQEFLVNNHQDLSELRDRILCEKDYESAEGDVSENPFQPTKLMNKDVFKSAMFFINDIFYIDGRSEGNCDYSVEIKEWCKTKHLPYDTTSHMESTYFNDINLRLGYPYLFMHQGNCEHLVIFTDARLINGSDSLVKVAYPLLMSYACTKGMRCFLCFKKLPKFIVVGMEELPSKKAYLCALCLYKFCYDKDGKKVSPFSVYKYVDRVALF